MDVLDFQFVMQVRDYFRDVYHLAGDRDVLSMN